MEKRGGWIGNNLSIVIFVLLAVLAGLVGREGRGDGLDGGGTACRRGHVQHR